MAAFLLELAWGHRRLRLPRRILGLAMELFKVKAGSWAYPEPAWAKFAGVPLFSGFMYASIISFLLVAQLKLRTMRTEPSPPSP